MSNYLFIFIWACCLIPFIKKPSWPTAFIVTLPLLYIVATRGWVADTILYRYNYINKVPSSIDELSWYMSTQGKDKAFYFVTALIKIFITTNPDIYFGIIAGFQIIALVFLFKKYSIDFSISFYLFIASTDYFSWMFNGIRQFTAVCIIILATPFFIKKKYLQSILIIVIASMFHKSALLMIPLIFIANGKAWNKKTIIFILLSVLAIIFVDQFTTLLQEGLEETQYRNVVSDYTNGGDNGTNPIRVLVYSVPAIISFIYRNKIRKKDDTVINFCTNMSIITSGIYLVSMVTSGIFIGRLPIYTSLYSYILLPWETEELFDNNKFIYLGMILAYAVFYYFQMHVVWRRF